MLDNFTDRTCNQLPDFSAYKEYGLKYQLAVKEIEMFRKSLTNSQSMDQGIEALVKSTAPSSTRQLYAKQGLTLPDLLMKVWHPTYWVFHL